MGRERNLRDTTPFRCCLTKWGPIGEREAILNVVEPESFSTYIRNIRHLGLETLIQGWIETHPKRRLPPVREIASNLRVSSRDVVAHLNELRAQGRIETRPGSGSWPTGAMPKRVDEGSPPRRDASDLANDLRGGIDDGRYATGERLPTAKELAKTWNCHPRTASRALEILVAEGRLARENRGWKVPRHRSSALGHRPKVLLVGAADPNGSLRMDTDREIDFWREISTEIARNQLESTRQFWDGEPLRAPAGTIGLIVSTWHQPDSPKLLDAARATRLPVCTWREGLDDAALRSLPHHPRLHLHDVAHSEQAGRDMGNHLVERSVGKAAWISPFHGTSWSRSREAGLRNRLEEGDIPLESFCREGISEWDFLGPAWNDTRLLETWPAAALDELTGDHARSVFAKAAEQRGLHQLLDSLSPLLERALETGADAWIACNDLVAALLKEWLVAKGAWNPGHLLLAGFDDSALALRHDLTSYRFDTAAMARSMVLQILSFRPRAQPIRPIRHGGHVVPRGSTSRA